MDILSQKTFIVGLPALVVAGLPEKLQGTQTRQPHRWLIQFHYGEPRLHYEISPVRGGRGWELGFHCEARDKKLNRFLLTGFRRHLFEIKDMLGEQMEAEMWDRGWTKIYEVQEQRPLTPTYQHHIAGRMAEIITHLHPIYAYLRNDVARFHR